MKEMFSDQEVILVLLASHLEHKEEVDQSQESLEAQEQLVLVEMEDLLEYQVVVVQEEFLVVM